MNSRVAFLLAGLGAVLLVVLFWLFLWNPKSDEIEQIEAQIETAKTQQATLRTQIARLEDVRARAPEIEAQLAAAESVVPRDVALPTMVRAMQLAATDSGVDLISISPAQPEAFSEEVAELARIPVTVQIFGSYFQIVDFLRRLEDPAITARGIEWETLNVIEQQYPTLQAVVSGEMYAIVPALPVVEEAPGDASPEPTQGASPAPSPSPSPTGGES